MHREHAAPEVVVAVRERALLEVVERGGGECTRGRAGLGGVGLAGVAVAVDEVVAALALDLEARDRGLQALRVAGAEVGADLEEQVVPLGVRERAAGVEADAAPVAVIADAAVDEGGGDEEVV